jgi:hypothetical protein
MLKLLSDGQESSVDMWNHKEINLVDCSSNGEVTSIVYLKNHIFSGHSDGTLKVSLSKFPIHSLSKPLCSF